jgi:hypothetical protein
MKVSILNWHVSKNPSLAENPKVLRISSKLQRHSF